MNVSVERLRVWLLAGAGLLVLVIASFLGYAHYRAHRFLTNLPKKLGSERPARDQRVYLLTVGAGSDDLYDSCGEGGGTGGWQGDAARCGNRAVWPQRGPGRQVSTEKSLSTTRRTSVIRAEGEVHIDLQAPQAADANAKMDYAAGKDLHGTEQHRAPGI